MTSLELDWVASQIEDVDSTDATQDEDDSDATDATQDEEIRTATDSTSDTQDKFLVGLEADSTESTQDKFCITGGADSTDSTIDKLGRSSDSHKGHQRVPPSEIIVRTISVERSAPLATLPADADAAFSQWLKESGLAPSRH